MNILLIGNKNTLDSPEEYYGEYAEFFEKALDYSKQGGSIKFTFMDDLIISVGDDEFSIYDTRNESDLNAYDLLLIRGKGFRNKYDVVKAVSSYGNINGIPVVNNYAQYSDSSKLSQAVQFYEHGMPVASTVLVTQAFLDGKAELNFGFPCIMKATYGAHGLDNYLVNDLSEVREIAANTTDKYFVLQRFIPNDRDYRILVIGDETVVIERSAATGSHLNNTSQGGSSAIASLDDIPKDIVDKTKDLMQRLGMTIAGADVLADKETGEFYFLEINSQPQLMTGASVDEKAKALGRYLDSVGN
jgi:glutathione synthase/RimK-type ligase-like ATP-grasp enzyme